MSESNLERRIRRLEDRTEIGALIARYGLAMDNRDMAEIEAIFTPDAVLRSRDGVMNAVGRDAIVQLYRGRFTVLGPSNHFTHDRIVAFDGADPDLARGTVVSHAEMNRKGQAMIAAIRYGDVAFRGARAVVHVLRRRGRVRRRARARSRDADARVRRTVRGGLAGGARQLAPLPRWLSGRR